MIPTKTAIAKPLSRFRPHRVSADQLGLEDNWAIVASASTYDDTQLKRLYAAAGRPVYQVRRRYYVDDGQGLEVVFEGDLDAAIDFYNGMG